MKRTDSRWINAYYSCSMVIKSCPLLMKDTETCVGSSLASYFVLFSLISFCFRWFRWFRFVFVDFVSFRFVSFLFRFALYRYPKPVCYLIYNTNKLYNLPSYSCVWPSTHVDVIDKRKFVRPLVLQLINCSRNFSSNSYLDNTQSIIITNTNL